MILPNPARNASSAENWLVEQQHFWLAAPGLFLQIATSLRLPAGDSGAAMHSLCRPGRPRASGASYFLAGSLAVRSAGRSQLWRR